MTLDPDRMAELFKHVAGRRFLGVIEATGCIELVFEHGESHPCNLISFVLEGSDEGVWFGGHEDPEGYIERCAR